MPIASVGTRGTLNSADLGTSATLTLTTPATIAVGNTLIMTIAVDNAGANGTLVFATISDPRNNQWSMVNSVIRDPGALDEGVQVFVYMCVVEEAYVALDALTIRFYSPGDVNGAVPINMDRGVINVWEFSGVARPANSTATAGASGSSTTAAPGALSPVLAGQLVIAAAAVETNAAITGDADTTDGSWVTLANAASNSGSAATSVSLISQYKITTGASAQNWAATWAGAADWAALGLVFDIYTAPSPAQATPKDNFTYPLFSGSETFIIDDGRLAVDTSTGIVVAGFANYGYNLSTNMHSFSSWEEPDERANTIIAHDVYLGAQDLEAAARAQITTVELPLRNVVLAGTTSIIGGGTALESLQHPGGNQYIQFDGSVANTEAHLYFDTTDFLVAYPDHRIVRVGVRFLGWKDDSSPAIPGEGFTVENVDTAGNYGNGARGIYGSWLTPDYKVNAKIQTRWLGETCLTRRASVNYIGQVSDNQAYPFTQDLLAHMASGDETFYINFRAQQGYDLLQTDVFLDYVVMVVEIVPETRSLVGNRIMSNMSGAYDPINPSILDNALNYSYSGAYGTAYRSALNADSSIQVPATSTTNPYITVVRQALPASPSDRFRVAPPDQDFQFTRAESFGPSPVLKSAAVLRNNRVNDQDHARMTLNNGIPLSLQSINKFVPSITFKDPAFSTLVGPSYIGTLGRAPYLLELVASTKEASVKVNTDGTTTYDHIHLLVGNTGQNDDLDFIVQQPVGNTIATATLTAADWADEPYVDGQKWKEINVPLSAPITPSAGKVFIEASCVGASAVAAWLIACYQTTNFGDDGYEWDVTADVQGAQFGGVPYVSVIGLSSEIPDIDYDITDVPATPDLGHLTQNCLTDLTLTVPQIVVNNASDYDEVSIERSADGGTTWTPVFLCEPGTTPQVADYQVPWDRPAGSITYRITGYRNVDRRTTQVVTPGWNNTVTAPGAAFGLAKVATPEVPGFLFAYIPVSSSGDLEVEYNPLNPVSSVQLHGIDYQVALRAPEERGLEVSVPVVVEQLTCLTAEIDDAEDVAKGQKALSPAPFDTFRALEGEDTLMLLLPGGHQRFVYVDIGSLSVTTSVGLYIGELTLTDATVPNVDPWDDEENE